MLAQPAPPVGHDGEHHYKLGGERQPGAPVEQDRDCFPRLAYI